VAVPIVSNRLRTERPPRRQAAPADPRRPGSRPSATAPVSETSEPPGSGPQPLPLDALAASWWSALESAQSALRAAGLSLSAHELGERGRHLTQERNETVQLLQGLGRELHTRSRLVDWVAAPSLTGRMLGLPSEVIACVYDLDGVLTASSTVHAAAWTETLDAFLLERAERSRRPFIPFDRNREYDALIAGRPRLDGVRTFLASRGISLPEGTPDDAPDAETVHGLANRKNRALQRRLDREGVAAFEGSRYYLEAARMLGFKRVVVSPSANTARILERAGLAHLIEERIDGNTIRAERLRPKPAPDTLLAACERLDVDPSQTVAFETTPAGITAARTAGFKLAIGVDRDGQGDALRASDADFVISDLAELLDRKAATATS
jgi:beta-phosphoglucomutase-like phosphatase (HAD superfamily)